MAVSKEEKYNTRKMVGTAASESRDLEEPGLVAEASHSRRRFKFQPRLVTPVFRLVILQVGCAVPASRRCFGYLHFRADRSRLSCVANAVLYDFPVSCL